MRIAPSWICRVELGRRGRHSDWWLQPTITWWTSSRKRQSPLSGACSAWTNCGLCWTPSAALASNASSKAALRFLHFQFICSSSSYIDNAVHFLLENAFFFTISESSGNEDGRVLFPPKISARQSRECPASVETGSAACWLRDDSLPVLCQVGKGAEKNVQVI